MLIAFGTPKTRECCQFWVRNPNSSNFIPEAVKALEHFYTKSKSAQEKLFIWVWSGNLFHIYSNLEEGKITIEHLIPPNHGTPPYQKWLEEHADKILNFYKNISKRTEKNDQLYENILLEYCQKNLEEIPFFHQGLFKVYWNGQAVTIENHETIEYANRLLNLKKKSKQNKLNYLDYKVFLHQTWEDMPN